MPKGKETGNVTSELTIENKGSLTHQSVPNGTGKGSGVIADAKSQQESFKPESTSMGDKSVMARSLA